MKLTNKDVAYYLSDALGYDEMMIKELKENGSLVNQLTEEEKEDCLNFCM